MIRYADRRPAAAPPVVGGDAAPPPLAAPPLVAELLGVIGEVLGQPVDQRLAGRSFADLGLGSLLAVRLIDRINRRYGLTLGIATVFECPTPGDLIARLAALGVTAAAPAVRSPLPQREPAQAMPIAVIGLSGRFGSAASPAEFWTAIRDGRSLVGPLSPGRRRLVAGRGAGVSGGFLDGIEMFDAGLFGLSPREARAIDPQQRLFLEQAWLAMENAGYPAGRSAGRSVGVYVGASASGYEKLSAEAGLPPDAWDMTGNLTALLASRISYHLDLRGPAVTVDTACSSSLVALDLACQGIVRGDCEMALAGGVGLFIDPAALGLMQRAGMMSAAGRCATFDAAADGIAIGEAVAAVLLKPLDRALADRDRIDAVVLATATNQDGRSNGITAPNSRAQAELIRSAIARAGLDADDIDLIEAHGTGTPLGDPVEIAGLAAAFAARRRAEPVWLGSAKANLGHSSEAAGLVGLIKVLLCLRQGEIAPLAGFRSLNPKIALADTALAVADAARPWPQRADRVRRAGISSFGLAGTNAHAVIEEGRPDPGTATAAGPWPFLLSAETDPLLAERAGGLAGWLRQDGAGVPLGAIAATLARGRSHFSRRAAVVASDRAALLAGLDALSHGEPPAVMAGGIDAAARFLAGEDDAAAELAMADFAAVDLPDQPLARDRHWAVCIEPAPEPAGEAGIALSPDDPMIGDHRIGGVAVLHAAALLHLALDATGAPGLAAVQWHRPLAVPAAGARLRLSTPAADGRITLQDGDGRAIAAFRPALSLTEASLASAPPAMADVLAMQAAADTIVTGGVAEPAPGVSLGPCYRGFDRLALGRDGAVGIRVLEAGAAPRLRLLDAAIQAAAAVAGSGDGAALRPRMPVALAGLARHAEPGLGSTYLLVRRRAISGAETLVDVDVLSAAGVPLLTLTGLALREMDSAAAAPAAAAAATDPAPRTMRPVWIDGGRLARGALAPRSTLLVATVSDRLADRLEAALAGAPSVTRIAPDAAMAAADWIAAAQGPARLLLLLSPSGGMTDALAVQAAVDAHAALILAIVRAIARAIGPTDRDLETIVVSRGAYAAGQPDAAGDPAQAAILGLAKVALGREVPGACTRLFDLSPHEIETIDVVALLADPGAWTGEAVAIRAGRRLERRLLPAVLAAQNPTAPRQVLIAGGFGRLGRVVARHAALRWRARIILVGRKPIDAERAAFLAELRSLGAMAEGVAADLTTADGVRAAFAAAAGPVDLVVQAVVDPVFGRAATVPAAEFLASLRPKIAGLAALRAAAAAAGAGRLLVFSSISAFAGFPGAAGQSAYAAQCAFEDAVGEAGGDAPLPTTVVHWGLWADPAWRPELLAQVKADGLLPMPADACLDALDAMLAAAGRHYVHAGLSDAVWRALGATAVLPPETAAAITAAEAVAGGLAGTDPAQHELIERHAQAALAARLAAAGLLGEPGSSEPLARVTGRLTPLPRMLGLAQALVGLLGDAGLLREAGDVVQWLAVPQADPGLAAAVRALGPAAWAAADLLDLCIAALPEILRGEVAATEILFPGGRMDRVEPLYRDQPGLAAANRIVAECLAALAAARPGLAAVEIGAGTGATTAAILDRLEGATALPARYLYTDISAGFVQHGRARYGRSWLDHGLLDIERDPGPQGLGGAFDVAVASNVLHATARIDETLAHAAALLRPGGLLILNENVRLEAFATLTFGLLDGWWRSADPQRRLAGGPLLDTARWRVALRQAGLDPIAELAPGRSGEASQRVILALKPGLQTVLTAGRVPAAATVRPAAAAPDGDAVTRLVRAIVGRALEMAPDTIDPDRPFAEYGVDSIISPQIADAISAEAGVALRSTELFSHPTVAALAAHVSGLSPTIPVPQDSATPMADAAQTNPEPAARDERIAIVGMAGRFPGAPDLERFWGNIVAGRSSIRAIGRFPVPATYDPGTGTPIPVHARWAGLIEDFDHFDPLFFHITPAEAEAMDPQQRLLLEEAWRALEDAGIVPASLAASRTGVFIGASANSYVAPAPPSLQTLGGSMAILSARLAYFLDLKGPAFPVDTGCSSSLVALHLACRSLAARECDLALSGGVAVNLLSADILAFLSDAGMASPRGLCRTFDDAADGFVPGEGVGVVVLKRLQDAERDGDPIRAVILATGINQDGRSNGITAPSAAAQTALEVEVWRRAAIDPATIGLVEAHGTGTRLGDPIEVNALTDAFRQFTDRRGFCAIGSVKTNIGHAMAAAGTAGLFKAALALQHGVVPPTLNFTTPNRHIDFAGSPFRVAAEASAWPAEVPRRAVVSAFGFSGSNAHIVLEAPPPRPPVAEGGSGPWMFPLSAKTPRSLERLRIALAAHVEAADTDLRLADMAWTLGVRRTHHRYRLAVIAADRAGLATALRSWQPTPDLPQPAIDLDRAVAAGHLADLVRAYGTGAALPFARLFAAPRRACHLPVYPFDDARYWNPLGHGAADARAVPIRLDATDWRLTQHQVQGAPMLPAAAVIELAAAALADRRGHPCPGLADLTWSRPLTGAGPFDLRLDPMGDGRSWRLMRADGEHATLAEAPEAPPPPPLDPAMLQQRSGPAVEGAAIYEAAAARGITYGPSFRLIDRLWAGQSEALGRFVARPGLTARNAAVIDAAMQTAAGIAQDAAAPAGLFVPVALGAVRWFGPAAPVWVHAAARRIDRDGAVFDIVLAAADGHPVAALDRLIARRMGPADPAAPTAVTTRHLAPAWVETPIAPHPVPDRTLVILGPRAAADRWAVMAERVVLLGADALDRLPAALAGRRTADVVIVLEPAADPLSLDDLPLATAIDRIDPHPALALILEVVQSLATAPGLTATRLLVASSGAADAAGHRATAAMLRCVAAEQPHWSVRAAAFEDGGGSPAAILAALPATRQAPADIRIRQGQTQSRRLVTAPEGGTVALPEGAACVIAGGAGGIGLLLAEHLIRRYRARIALLSRRPPDAAATARLAALEAVGGAVLLVEADIADGPSLRTALDRVRQAFGPLQAVFNLAGTRRDGIAAAKTPADLAAVLRAKVAGTVALDRLTRDDPLALFCAFGSTAAEFPTFGQADYAAANGFLSGFAIGRAAAVVAGRRRGDTRVIAWPLWLEGGMSVPAELLALLRRDAGFEGLSTEAAFRALETACGITAPVQVVLHGRGDVAAGLERLGMAAALGGEASERGAVGSAAAYVAGLLAEVARLPPERIEPGTPFEEYGIDSIMITRLNAALERDLGGVSKTLFFEYRTVGEVAAYLERAHADVLARLVRPLPAGASVPMPAPAADAPVPAAPQDDAVAIIGIAGIYPGAEDLEAFWRLLESGADLIREIPPDRWPLAGFYDPDRENPSTSHSKWGGFIDGADGFDPRFFDMSPIEAESLDPQARKFLEVAWWALEDAGYGRHSLFARDPQPARRAGGVFVGLMHADYPLLAADARARGELAMTASGDWTAANRVSHFLDFRGPSLAVGTACSASLTAVHMAVQALRGGDCTVAIAGGVNISLHPMKYWMLSKAGFAASDGRCRSFGEGGDGYVPGEGAGAVLLKPLARARADGDRIHAIIRASAVNHGGRTSGFTVPNPVAQGELIAEALRRAGLAPDSISYVEAHGTGTALGDPIEINGLRRAFGTAGCPIGSVKSNVGHLESAAGIVALTKVVLQMRHGRLAPSLHSAELNRAAAIPGSGFRVVQSAEPWNVPDGHDGHPRRAGVSSFGAGGANAHLILEAPPPGRIRAERDRPLPILLSARTPAALSVLAGRLAAMLDAAEPAALVDIAATLALGREAMRCRAGFVAAGLDEAAARLRAFAAGSAGGTVDHADAALDAALQAWLGGGTVDWQPFFPSGFARTALPLYPFERRRCWLPTRPDPAFRLPGPSAAAIAGSIVLHPADPLVADHRVGGRLLAAGALLLSRLLASAGAGVPCRLAAIAWTSPVAVEPGGTTVAVSAEAVPEGRRLRLGDAMTLTIAAQVPPPEAPQADLAVLRARCPQSLARDRIYGLLASAGVVYGPSYALLDIVHVGDGEALGRMLAVAPEEASAVQPGPLDAAMQLCFALVQEDSEGLRPVSAEGLTLWRPLSMARFAHARRTASGPGCLVASLDLFDDGGEPVASLTGLTLRRAETRQDAAEEPPLRMLRPIWSEVGASPAAPPPAAPPDGITLVLGHAGDAGFGAALAAAVGQGAVLRRLRAGEDAEAWLAAEQGRVACVIFLGGWRPHDRLPVTAADHEDQRETASLALLRLIKALPESGVTLRVVTGNAQAVAAGEIARPEPAAVMALAKAAGRDRPDLAVRLIDLDTSAWADAPSRAGMVAAALGDAEAPADAECAWRDGAWFAKRLETLAAAPEAGFHAAGRYLIAGAGGIGRALARHLAERHGADVWLVGRRPLSRDEATTIARPSRGSVTHRVADLADPAALAAVMEEAAGPSRRLDGVFHAALVMHDALIGALSEADFRAVLAPKATGAINLLAALDGIETGFVCAFSSSNAYTANRGQSAYAAASAFLDALILARGGPAARVIDWGLWGEAGRMANAASLAAMRRLGVWPIGNEEGFAALSAILAGPVRQVLALKLRAELLGPLGVEAAAPNDAVAAALDGVIRAAPPPADLDPRRFAAVDGYARALLAETLARAPLPAPAGPAMARLAEAVRLAAAAAPSEAAAELRRDLLAAGEAAPYLALLDRTVPALPDVLAGRVKATALLFPDGSDHLVKAIYQGNRLVDWLQRLAAEAIAAEVRQRLMRDPEAHLRILEIGAGTGATTAFLRDALAPFAGRVTYVFTDVGPSFLVAGRRRFADHWIGFETRLLDISQPGAPQGVPDGSIDIVLAANVIHATPRIAASLGHIGRMLRPDGLLALKEATSAHDFNTLTFGLTAEWWAFDDPEQRLPGGPLLSRAGWTAALHAAQFRDPRVFGLPGTEDVEIILLARAPLDECRAQAVPRERLAPPPGRPTGAVEAALLQVVAEALHLAPHEVEPGGSFADYGADSIISVELVRRINERFGIDLKTTALFNFATVRDLARFIEINLPDAAHDPSAAAAAVDRRVTEARGRTQRLRERIEARRQAAPVNAEAAFLARETAKSGAMPAASSLDALLASLAAGDINVDDAMKIEVTDDA